MWSLHLKGTLLVSCSLSLELTNQSSLQDQQEPRCDSIRKIKIKGGINWTFYPSPQSSLLVSSLPGIHKCWNAPHPSPWTLILPRLSRGEVTQPYGIK